MGGSCCMVDPTYKEQSVMTLSPFEVERREFGRTAFGYKSRDVDHFLDEVHRSLSQLWQDRSDTREENERLKERLVRFEQLEDQLKNTLLLAQDSAEKAHEQARRESDLVMREAGHKARDLVHVAHEDKQRLEMVLRDLHGAEQEARQRLRGLAGAIMSHLDDTEQLVPDTPQMLSAAMLAHPASTELRSTSVDTLADVAEKAALAAESAHAEAVVEESGTVHADRISLDAEIIATANRRMDAPHRVEVSDAAPMRELVTGETADAFFDAPPTFDPSATRERTPSFGDLD